MSDLSRAIISVTGEWRGVQLGGNLRSAEARTVNCISKEKLKCDPEEIETIRNTATSPRRFRETVSRKRIKELHVMKDLKNIIQGRTVKITDANNAVT